MTRLPTCIIVILLFGPSGWVHAGELLSRGRKPIFGHGITVYLSGHRSNHCFRLQGGELVID